jgi:hypothetical protein
MSGVFRFATFSSCGIMNKFTFNSKKLRIYTNTRILKLSQIRHKTTDHTPQRTKSLGMTKTSCLMLWNETNTLLWALYWANNTRCAQNSEILNVNSSWYTQSPPGFKWFTVSQNYSETKRLILEKKSVKPKILWVKRIIHSLYILIKKRKT